MPKMKYWNGSAWIIMDAKDADTVDGKHASDFALQTGFTTHQADYVTHLGYGATTNTANAYAVTLSPAPTSYTDGMSVKIKVNVDSTGASTLNVNGLGAKALKNTQGNDITGLKANGVYTLCYNASTGNFISQGEGVDATSLITATNGILGM